MNWKHIGCLLGIIVGLLILVVGGGYVFFIVSAFQCSESVLANVRVVPPPSATVLRDSCASGFAPGNAEYRVTFTLPPEDMPAMQALTPISRWTQNPADAVRFEDEAASASSVIVGYYSDGAYVWEVLVDTSRADLYTVYLAHAFID